jgi:CBS domain-containing protein
MKLDVKVGECMTVGVLTLPASASIKQAAKLLKKSRVGSVIATKDGKAVGIITERDIVYSVVAEGKSPEKTKLKDIMSKPLKVIKANQTIEDAALALKQNNIKRLPVVDSKGQLVGIVSEGDLMRVYPGVVDIISEESELGPYDKENHVYTGVCEQCGSFSESLRMQTGRLYCEECLEEEEV